MTDQEKIAQLEADKKKLDERVSSLINERSSMIEMSHNNYRQLEQRKSELLAEKKELEAKLKCSECGGTDSVCGTAWLKDKERLEAENTALKAEVAKLRKVVEEVKYYRKSLFTGNEKSVKNCAKLLDDALTNLEEGKNGRVQLSIYL